MRFSVGYQLRETPDFTEEILRLRERISEVYFSWGDFANGRNSLPILDGLTPWEAQRRQEEELAAFSGAGIALHLLFNATCYGRDSLSRAFFTKIGNTVDYLAGRYALRGITTTSPLIGRFIHENFKGLDVRASVNMGIGTVEGLDYAAEYYDSFYLAREYNRDFGRIREAKAWCGKNGRKLYGLANSGCLNHCSAHVFHDNLVSHEAEIAAMDNGYAFEGVCRGYLAKPEHRPALLTHTSFIRPEDTALYEGLFGSLKLATRVSPCPVRILRAYTAGHFRGNILELLEPNHAGILYPKVLENSRITARVTDGKLLYGNLEEALIDLEEDYADK